jgi:hypothetical protein
MAGGVVAMASANVASTTAQPATRNAVDRDLPRRHNQTARTTATTRRSTIVLSPTDRREFP